MTQRIDVVAAVIIRDGRILLTQRSPKGSYPWLFESPGGKVDQGETHSQALVRELREELAIEATVLGSIASLPPVDVAPRDGAIPRRVYFMRALIGFQIPIPRVAVDLGWFTPGVLMGLKMTPANEARREELVALVRGA